MGPFMYLLLIFLALGVVQYAPSLLQGGPEPQTLGGEKEQPYDHLYPPQHGE